MKRPLRPFPTPAAPGPAVAGAGAPVVAWPGAAAAALLLSWAGTLAAQDSPPPPYTAVPVAPEPAEEPAADDPVAIPRYDEAAPGAPAAPLRAVPTEAVEAVEIPPELAGEDPEEAEEPAMEVEADVEEEVERGDSLVEAVADVPEGEAPVTAEDLRAQQERSRSERPGQVGSSVLTRPEARTFTFSIPAPRGQILDRNGYPLAQSRVVHYAAINFPFLGPGAGEEEILRYAGERIRHVRSILGADWDLSREAVLKHYQDRRWLPLPFSSVLTDEQIAELRRQRMEGLTLHPIYLRYYPQGPTLAHVVGYVGKRPPRVTGPIVNDEPLWGEGEGVDGLEQAFEVDLRGTPGRINVVFESDGTKIKEDVLRQPRPGHNVITAIDLELQRHCEDVLAEMSKRGAVVVMDVRNGDIVAMASHPQHDPNDFIPSVTREKYSALVEDPDKPLFPRAFRAAYPPASTFKVPVALGYLENGHVSVSDLYPCPSSWSIADLVMRNWNTDSEGSMNVIGALTRSCNTWFYEVAVRGGADAMSSMAMKLGLGQKTGIPLNEAEGFIPSNRAWLDRYGHMMSAGDNAVMSIGQGRVETTPLQMARMMAAIGNGRQVPKPRLVLQVQDLNHELERTFPAEMASPLQVHSHSLQVVRRGLYDAVNAGNGTGGRARHKITVSGKTGTGQWKLARDPADNQNIAWFAGFFPSKHPVYAFAVIYEGDPGETVGGGRNAAPIVGEFLDRYLTEENYNRVRDESNALRDEEEEIFEVEPYRRLTSAEPVQSIFRDGTESDDAEGELEAMVPEQEARGREPRGGLIDRIFGRGRR